MKVIDDGEFKDWYDRYPIASRMQNLSRKSMTGFIPIIQNTNLLSYLTAQKGIWI